MENNFNEILNTMADGIKDLAREDARHKKVIMEIGMRPVILFWDKVKDLQNKTFQPDVIVFLGCIKDCIDIYHQATQILTDLENFNYDEGDFMMELQFKSIERCYKASEEKLAETRKVMESVGNPRTVHLLMEELKFNGILF